MEKKSLLLIPLVFLLAISLIAIGCPGTTTPTTTTPTTTTPTTTTPTKTLKIGAISTLTGQASEGLLSMKDGMVLCKDWINENGGITVAGEKYLIELVIEDDKGTIEGSVTATTKLVERDKVKFIVGQALPDMVLAAADVTDSAGVLHTVSAGGGIPGGISPYRFETASWGIYLTPINFGYLLETYPDVKKLAVVATDDISGNYMVEGLVKPTAAQLGLEVAAAEYYLPDEKDFYPLWTRVLAAEPDALDIEGGGPLIAASILKQGRELGFEGPVFADSPFDIGIVRDIAGDFADNYFNSVIDSQSSETTPAMKELINRWAEEIKTPVVNECYLGWNCLWCTAQAIEAAQSLDPTEVAAAWEQMESIETIYGTGYMGGLNTFGLNHVIVTPMPISKLEEGEIKFVKWVLPEVP